MNDATTAARDLSAIPAAACMLRVGDFELGDNGEKAKTAPVRLVARSGQPIEHWFWGRVVHDLSGMRLSKPRLPIDYVHDAREVIGYLNKFNVEGGDLVTSGALVPYRDNDRASEIVHKARHGVPYEASINFGGDGIKVQDVADGEVAEVNGYRFEGPGVIVREWPLRGVAICPYGADQNTESAVLAAGNKTFAAAAWSQPKKENGEATMSEEVKPAADAAAETQSTNLEAEKPVDAPVAEVPPVEIPAAAVEATSAEGAEAKQEEKAPEPAPVEPQATPVAMTREEFARIRDEFGADVAAQILMDGGDYNDALALAYVALKAEAKALRESVAQFGGGRAASGTPAPVAAAKPAGAGKLFNTGK